jgi:hypothetical protein
MLVGVTTTAKTTVLMEPRSSIRGTSIEDDVLEFEQVLHESGVFVLSHVASPMTRDYFWNYVKAKTAVGSPRDHCKTTVGFDEHNVM